MKPRVYRSKACRCWVMRYGLVERHFTLWENAIRDAGMWQRRAKAAIS